MLKILEEKWGKNADLLLKKISEEITEDNSDEWTYCDLVKLTFDTIFNDGVYNYNCYDGLDTDHITVVDNGDYQGTVLFLIPYKTYQPNESEYLMTCIGYGSCSGCDALQNALCLTPDGMHKAIFMITATLINNTIKPYNHGWQYDGDFDRITF